MYSPREMEQKIWRHQGERLRGHMDVPVLPWGPMCWTLKGEADPQHMYFLLLAFISTNFICLHLFPVSGFWATSYPPTFAWDAELARQREWGDGVLGDQCWQAACKRKNNNKNHVESRVCLPYCLPNHSSLNTAPLTQPGDQLSMLRILIYKEPPKRVTHLLRRCSQGGSYAILNKGYTWL